jgi:DNA polymerase III alpha subunit
MPDEYKELDIKVWLLEKLQEELQSDPRGGSAVYSKEWTRVNEEYAEYASRGMDDLLRYMIYLVDFMRENDIVWGVGRGSSVASYVLYLIGVHKINSIQYDLDWTEFLR